MTILELLEQVHDRESFLEFAYAFAEERRRVEGIEATNPNIYHWGKTKGAGYIFKAHCLAFPWPIVPKAI